MKYIFVISLSLCSLLAGCPSIPKKTDDLFTPKAPAGQWETKAQVKDFKQNQTNNLSIDMVAVKNQLLRMEISATLGYPVASLVTTPKNLRMALYTQKKFFHGSNKPEALRPALGVSLDPNIIHNIIFDIPIRGWNCENNPAGQVSVCKKTSPSGEMVVAWPERKEDSKRVIIHAPQFEMQWLFKSHNVLQQLSLETFKLAPPAGYKVIPL
jgi:hypothetical protein